MAVLKSHNNKLQCRLCGANAGAGPEMLCSFCSTYESPHPATVVDLLRDIDRRFDQALDALRSHKRKDLGRNIVGWYHHLDEQGKVGISSTAYALHALSLLTPRDPDLHQIAEGVLDHSERLNFPADGGGDRQMFAWPMQSSPGIALVEPTCYVLQQLLEAGQLARDDARAVGGLDWLLTQQRADGSWASLPSLPPSTYVTALACQVLSEFEYTHATDQLAAARNWLHGARNKDDGWGKHYQDNSSNAWCTSHALIALHQRSTGAEDANAVPGVQWLRSHRDRWSELLSDEYFVESKAIGKVPVRYEFQPHPIVLIALDHAGVRPLAPDVLKAVEELLQRERDGVWIWTSSSRKTIFNLSHSIQALSAVRARFNHAEQIRILLTLGDSISAISTPKSLTSEVRSPPADTGQGAQWFSIIGQTLLLLFGVTLMMYAAVPTSTLANIAASFTPAFERVKDNAWIFLTGVLAIGLLARIRWRVRTRTLIVYTGIAISFAVYLRAGENGLIGVAGSLAATLLLAYWPMNVNDKADRD